MSRVPAPPRKSRWRRVAIPLGAGLAAGWVVSVAAVLATALGDDAPSVRADAIVVLGAAQYGGRPSPVLKARLDHAVALWRQGVAPRLVLTGGVGVGDTMSEAAAGRRYVRRLGVPDSALVLEHEGRTTRESLRNAAELLLAKGWPRVMLVSDPLHLRRASILARRFGLTPATSPARDSPVGFGVGTLVSESFKTPTAFIFERGRD